MFTAAMLLISSLQVTPVLNQDSWFITNGKTNTCVPLQALGVKNPTEFAHALESTGSRVSIKYHTEADGSMEATATIVGNVGVGVSTFYTDDSDCTESLSSGQ